MKNLRYLKSFLSMIKYSSLAEYSKRTGAAHAHATHIIKEVEKEFGCQIVERQRKRIQLQLTAAGQHLVKRAPVIIAEFEDLQKQTAHIANPSQQITLNLYVARSICDELVCRNLPTICDAVPEVKLNIFPKPFLMTHEDKVGSLTIGTHVETTSHDCIRQVHLHTFSVNLWASTSYLDLYGEPLQMSDLHNHRFVSFSPESSLCKKLKELQLYREENLTFIQTPSGIANAAQAGCGLTLCNKNLRNHDQPSGKVVLPELTHQMSFYFSYPEDWHNAPFVHKLTEVFTKLLAQL